MLRHNNTLPLLYRSAIFLIIICLTFALGVQPAFAAPIGGKIVNITLPDGSIVQARVWGDEFYQHAESLDGYTLMVDQTGWVYYAQLNADGSDLVSTGIRYTGRAQTDVMTFNGKVLPKGLKISKAGITRKVSAARQALHADSGHATINGGDFSAAAAPQGNVLGLSLLVDFPDVQGALFASEMQNFLNQPGYTGFGNNGSLRDFYYAISGGRITYTQSIFRFTASRNKSYYTDPAQPYGSRAGELIREGLNALKNTGFNFSTLTNSGGFVLATNAFYAGGVTNAWGQGMWPHQGSLSPSFSANGVTLSKYQITGVGNSIELFTTAHENGHMVLGCPDTYDYDGNSRGAGNFDLMSYTGGGSTNPPPPNPYCRVVLAGWGTSTTLNSLPNLTQVSVAAGSLTPLRWNGTSTEFFMIENIRKTGRWANMPDEGLLIWHIETRGNNSYEQMTASNHYAVSVEQADGLFHLEHNTNSGGANDLFHLGNKDIFNAASNPNANWWNGAASGLDISNISAVGDTMSFVIHTTVTGPTLTPTAVISPTRTLTRTPTATAGITSTPTRTPTQIIGASPTRTATVTLTSTRTPTPAISNTPTQIIGASPTRTVVSSPTPTAGTGTACSPVTSIITAPFTFDGAGTFCWQSSNLGAYINSWNATNVAINGINITNVYMAAGSYPAKIGGFWYVSYNSSVAWGHFEAK